LGVKCHTHSLHSTKFLPLLLKYKTPVDSLILGWGEGIFARPRFSAAAEFRANFVGAPPKMF